MMHKILIFFLIGFVSLGSGCDDECNKPDCRQSLGSGGRLRVLDANEFSGEEGTLITNNVLDSLSVTSESAVVRYTFYKISNCHLVIGYGHTWSSVRATPTVEFDNFTDYETNVNFNDEVVSLLGNLNAATKYWVRSWVAVESNDCFEDRKILYSDEVLEFTTL